MIIIIIIIVIIIIIIITWIEGEDLAGFCAGEEGLEKP